MAWVKQRLDVAGAVEDANHVDAVVDGVVKDRVIADREAAEAGREVRHTLSHRGRAGKHLRLRMQFADGAGGGEGIKLGDVAVDVFQVKAGLRTK
jgi:hypothetical protein